MKRILKEGDKGKAICYKCEDLMNITFKVRDVPLSKSKEKVKDLLAGVCNKCDAVISIPHQSSIKIKEHREKSINQIEVRVPFHYTDILNVACNYINNNASYGPLSVYILKYYVHHLANDKRRNKNLSKYTKSTLFKGKANYRVSINFNNYILNDFKLLQQETNLTKSNLLKSIILLINDDINNEKSEKNINFLRASSYMV